MTSQAKDGKDLSGSPFEGECLDCQSAALTDKSLGTK